MAKRCFDVCVSVVLLLLATPALVVAVAAVWLESGCPVLFRQKRIGLGFQPFFIIKLRTMCAAEGCSVTVAGDRRVTQVGRVLRATKIDELPQLFNVISGDMSLVGPRPEVPEYVARFEHRFRSVLTVRPGITDLASIRYRDEEKILAGSDDPLKHYADCVLPAKLVLAQEYVNTNSVLGDIGILLRTVASLLRVT